MFRRLNDISVELDSAYNGETVAHDCVTMFAHEHCKICNRNIQYVCNSLNINTQANTSKKTGDNVLQLRPNQLKF